MDNIDDLVSSFLETLKRPKTVDWTNPTTWPGLNISQMPGSPPDFIVEQAKRLSVEQGMSEGMALNATLFSTKYDVRFKPDGHIDADSLRQRWPKREKRLADLVDAGLPAFLFTKDHKSDSINQILRSAPDEASLAKLNPFVITPKLWWFSLLDILVFEKLCPHFCGLEEYEQRGSLFMTTSEAKDRWKAKCPDDVVTLAARFELRTCIFQPWEPYRTSYGACWLYPHDVRNQNPEGLLLFRPSLWAIEKEHEADFNFRRDRKRNELIKTHLQDFASIVWRSNPQTTATEMSGLLCNFLEPLYPFYEATFTDRAIERWIGKLNPVPRRGPRSMTTKT